MNLKERGCDGVDWIILALDREKRRVIVNTVMNFGLHERRAIY
jgi:hypothetical protein